MVCLWFSYWFRHISEPLPLRTTAQGAQVSRSRPLGCSGRSFRDWRITRLLNLRSVVRRVWRWHGEFMRVYPSKIWVSSWLYIYICKIHSFGGFSQEFSNFEKSYAQKHTQMDSTILTNDTWPTKLVIIWGLKTLSICTKLIFFL